MLILLATVLAAAVIIFILIRTTKPKMKVWVTTSTHEEKDASGQWTKVRDSVSANYDPVDHQLEVEEWRQDWKVVGLLAALVVVIVIGVVAYTHQH